MCKEKLLNIDTGVGAPLRVQRHDDGSTVIYQGRRSRIKMTSVEVDLLIRALIEPDNRDATLTGLSE